MLRLAKDFIYLSYKEWMMITLLIFCIIFFSACSDTSEKSDKSTEPNLISDVEVSKSSIEENDKKEVDKSSIYSNNENKKDKNSEKVNISKKMTLSKKIGGYSLGTEVNSLKKKLKKDGYKITLPPDFEEGADPTGAVSNPLKDGRIYQYDGSYFFYTKHISFDYTNENVNFAITVNSDKYKTKDNIAVGATMKSVMSQYGDPIRANDDVLEYYKDELYLTLYFDGNKVSNWSISSLPMDFNAP